MPQYFGIHIGYDLTCTRLADLLIVLYMFLNRKILTHFGDMVIHHIFIIPFAIYLFVSIYTMVCRVDINAFFLVFLEILTFYILVYGIRYIVGWKRAIKLSIGCAYFLGIYGLIEFFCGQSIFLKFFSTVPNSVANSYRSGFYRIMGPCGHALGYGLLLLLFIALACMDIEKDEVYLFKRPFLIGLLYVNVFLTGSRNRFDRDAFDCIDQRSKKYKEIMHYYFLSSCCIGWFPFAVWKNWHWTLCHDADH